MPKVNFIFNKEKDLWNIHRVCNREYRFSNPSLGMPKKVLDIAKGKTLGACRKALEKNYKPVHNSPLIPIVLKAADEAWSRINDEYFDILQKITKKPICADIFTAELTVVGSCPYDTCKNSFMFGMFMSIPGIVATAAHEIMHLQFHKYFWEKTEKEIGFDKTDDLKEALTVLLNSEFRHLWFVQDEGYDSHQELREFINTQWKKDKDFGKLIKECVIYLKEKDKNRN